MLIASAPFNSAVITLEGRETGRVRVQVGEEYGVGVVLSICLSIVICIIGRGMEGAVL